MIFADNKTCKWLIEVWTCYEGIYQAIWGHLLSDKFPINVSIFNFLLQKYQYFFCATSFKSDYR